MAVLFGAGTVLGEVNCFKISTAILPPPVAWGADGAYPPAEEARPPPGFRDKEVKRASEDRGIWVRGTEDDEDGDD